MLCGIYNKSDNIDRLIQESEKLAKHAQRINFENPKLILSDNQFCIFETLHQSSNGTKCITIESEDSVTIFYDINGTKAKDKSFIQSFFQNHDWNVYPELQGNWIAINWNKVKRKMKIATDFMGSVWLYICVTPDGLAFSQDYASLIEHSEIDIKLNRENALLELVLGYIPDDSTLHNGISIVPPASLVEIDYQGYQLVEQRLPNYDGKYFDISLKEKYSILDEHFEEIFKSSILPGIDDTCLSLSAGLDSRYALALLDKHGYRCDCFSYGIDNSVEIYEARKVVSKLNVSHKHFNFINAKWDVWGDGIKKLGGTGKIQMSGWSDEWLSLLSSNHKFVLHGFLGDALSGKHLVRSREYEWLDNWVSWSLSSWASSNLLKGYTFEEIKKIVKIRMLKVIEGIDFASQHQMIMHLDIFGRQRRWVASQPNMMSDFISPKTFFCNSKLTDFWVNLPFSDLDEQKLYKEYAHNRFPKFFPKNSSGLYERIKNKFQSKYRYYTTSKPLLGYPIDREAIILQNANSILDLYQSSTPAFSSLLDLQKMENQLVSYKKEGAVNQKEAAIILRGCNLMFIASGKSF